MIIIRKDNKKISVIIKAFVLRELNIPSVDKKDNDHKRYSKNHPLAVQVTEFLHNSSDS